MTVTVVDTNAAVTANGGPNVHASNDCQLKCIEALRKIVKQGIVAIDTNGGILAEYQKRLRPEGQPGVGDLFYRHVIDRQGDISRVRAHNVGHRRADALRAAFAATGTLADFDTDDRVFALCAVAANATVLTATDSDWVEHEVGLRACRLKLWFVCGKAAAGGT